MTSPGNASDDLPICCYCDHPLSCAQCGKEQPADDISSLRAQLAAARKALEEIAKHPERKEATRLDQSSYAVGWAFWNVQNIAKAALRSLDGGGK